MTGGLTRRCAPAIPTPRSPTPGSPAPIRVAVRALELFAEILGAEAGNVALRNARHGGVVIGGGIPPKILPVLQRGSLLERFAAKGRFASWLRALSVRVVARSRRRRCSAPLIMQPPRRTTR